MDGYEKDVYYEAVDRLHEHVKMAFREDAKEYMLKYIGTSYFWNRLYRKRPDMKGYVSF